MVGVLFGYGWLNCVVRVQSVTWVGIHPLLPVSGTGTGFDPLPSRERLFCLVHPRHTPPLWIADQVRNDGGYGAALDGGAPPCGFPPTRE